MTKILLAAGANPDIKSNGIAYNGLTAYEIAVKNNNNKVAKLIHACSQKTNTYKSRGSPY